MATQFVNKWKNTTPKLNQVGLRAHIKAVQTLSGASQTNILNQSGLGSKKWDVVLLTGSLEDMIKIMFFTYQEAKLPLKYPYDGIIPDKKLAQLDTASVQQAPPTGGPNDGSFVVAMLKK